MNSCNTEMNDCRYIASRTCEVISRFDLIQKILDQYGADRPDALYEDAEHIAFRVRHFQRNLQEYVDSREWNFNCGINYCFGSAAFQEFDPSADYAEFMERWSDPDYWEPSPPSQRSRLHKLLEKFGCRICRVLTWRPHWMLHLGGRPINFPIIKIANSMLD